MNVTEAAIENFGENLVDDSVMHNLSNKYYLNQTIARSLFLYIVHVSPTEWCGQKHLKGDIQVIQVTHLLCLPRRRLVFVCKIPGKVMAGF